MEANGRTKITVKTTVEAPVEMVWKYWTAPEDITGWNFASDDWCSPRAENDLRAGGKFNYRMEARDGSTGFDFEGSFLNVEPLKNISYLLGDGRKVDIVFSDFGNRTEVVETFEAENTNSVELQRVGWQSILNNFKKYSETKYHKKSWVSV